MSSDMLRTSKSCLADGTLVIPSHCVRSSRSQSRLEKKKKSSEKKRKMAEWTGLLPPHNLI